MGLAASQARFLCITARKANCEYKTTDLAQQRLELSNQMTAISNDYNNALNATTLMWSNPNVNGDFGISYALLMTPSDANDYNPYLLTTKSGAIILNREFATAAKAAGISMVGGGSSDGITRDKFYAALAANGVITQTTADAITVNDFNVNEAGELIEAQNSSTTGKVLWDRLAGMGGYPKEFNAIDYYTIDDICASTFANQDIDWVNLFDSNSVSKSIYNEKIKDYNKMISQAEKGIISKEIELEIKNALSHAKTNLVKNPDNAYLKKVENATTELDNIISTKYDGKDAQGYCLDAAGNRITVSLDFCLYYGITADIKGLTYANLKNALKSQIEKSKAEYETKYENNSKNLSDTGLINTGSSTQLTDGKYQFVKNDILLKDSAVIEHITVADILADSYLLVARNLPERGGENSYAQFSKTVKRIFEALATNLGYNETGIVTGIGLNVDEASAEALSYALKMTEKQFLDPDKIVANYGKSSSPSSDGAYLNAYNYNAIGADIDRTEYAVSFRNMLDSFLTYYDNALNGGTNGYLVAKSISNSQYVTDDSGYQFVVNDTTSEHTYTQEEKVAYFYDTLFNNLVEYGWREDDRIEDFDYLEEAITDGKYITSGRYTDGYYYQTNYSTIPYIDEVADADKRARAEAEYTSKKAQITAKEEEIDIDMKQLDAEMAALSTEYDSVKQLISNNVQKVFTMFSN